MDNYLSALSNKDNIVDVMVAKLIFLGPSMQGKTVTRQRITKGIKNIASDNLDKSNTGVSEQNTVLICKRITHATALARDDNDWTMIDVEDECLFCLEPSRTKSEVPPQLESSVTGQVVVKCPKHKKIMPSSEQTPGSQYATDVHSKDQQVRNNTKQYCHRIT